MQLIHVNQHPNFDIEKFNELKFSFASPKTEIINEIKPLLLKGWIFSIFKEDISIIIKQGEKYERFSLNEKRKDVKSKLFERESTVAPLSTGFLHHLNYKSNFDIYIEIANELFAWKQVKYETIEIDLLTQMKTILFDMNSLNPKDIFYIQNLSKTLKNNYIHNIFSLISIFNASTVSQLKVLSESQKVYLKNFISEIEAPSILMKMFHSIETTGSISLSSPFSKDTSSLVLNISFQNVNYLKFHSEDGDFYIIQFLHTVDAIYFPKYNLMFRPTNSHFDMQHIKNLFHYLFFEFDLTKEANIDRTSLTHKGIVLNGVSPYHFYYDVLPILAYMYESGHSMTQLKHIFCLNAKSYFSLNQLYNLNIRESNISSEKLQSIIEKENGFVIHIGSSYKNISSDFIEKLDKKLIISSIKKYQYAFKHEKKQIEKSDFVLWIGISSQKRAWLNQNELIIKLLDMLSLKFNKITVIFDGMTKSIFSEESKDKAVLDDISIVNTISSSLKENIFVINLINKSSSEKIYYAYLSDFFIANYSTGSIYPSRMCKKHGLTHLSNSMFNIVKDIHIHHNIEHFSEDVILDIPDKKNSRVDFVSYQLEEEVFLSQTLKYIDKIYKSKLQRSMKNDLISSGRGTNKVNLIEKLKNKALNSLKLFEKKSASCIFVHIPKTAGTSFRIAIERDIKLDKILYDYGKNSKTTSPFIVDTLYSDNILSLPYVLQKNDIKFIIGHFNVGKYLTIFEKPKIVTFIRDPLQRIVSEYKHKQRLDNYKQSFETFYMQDNQQNKQFKFLQGVKLKDIFFMGLTEEYHKSITLFNKKTNLNIKELILNRSEKSIHSEYEISEKTRKILEELNDKDMELYREAKKFFYKELEKYEI